MNKLGVCKSRRLMKSGELRLDSNNSVIEMKHNTINGLKLSGGGGVMISEDIPRSIKVKPWYLHTIAINKCN